jgi:hypothetical protein
VENLNVSTRHGARPHFFQTLAMVTLLSPSSAASSRDDQCVTPSRAGGASRVASTIATSSICCARPGLGRSWSPPRPSAAYRCFQEITVCLTAPTRSAISFVPTPSAASNTIRARWARPAGIDGARSQPSSTARSLGGTCTPTVNGMIQYPGKPSVSPATSLTGH